MTNAPKFPPLTIRSLLGTTVEVPLNYVLGTSAVAIRKAPLLLVDLETEEGVTGRTYLFCYLPAAAQATPQCRCPVAPLWSLATHFLLAQRVV